MNLENIKYICIKILQSEPIEYYKGKNQTYGTTSN